MKIKKLNKSNNKRAVIIHNRTGQAQVIVTVLIILIVLGIIGVVGSMVTRMVSEGSDEAMKTFKSLNSDASLKKITRNEDLGIIGVQIQEGPDSQSVSGFKIVVKDAFGNSEVHDFSLNLGPLETDTVYFRTEILDPVEIGLFPVVDGEIGGGIDEISGEDTGEIELVDYTWNCYQENPTTSHSRDQNCNIFYLGGYSCEGDFSELCENALDGDWTTRAKINNAVGLRTIYLNYSKPFNAVSANWNIIEQSTTEIIPSYIHLITSGCWSYSDSLVLKIDLEAKQEGRNVRNLISSYCFNGVGWETILLPRDGDSIYDESINWTIA